MSEIESLTALRAAVQERRDVVHKLENGGPGYGRMGEPAFAQCQAFSLVLSLIDNEVNLLDGAE